MGVAEASLVDGSRFISQTSHACAHFSLSHAATPDESPGRKSGEDARKQASPAGTASHDAGVSPRARARQLRLPAYSNVTRSSDTPHANRDFFPRAGFHLPRTEVANVKEKFPCNVRTTGRAGVRDSPKSKRAGGDWSHDWRAGLCAPRLSVSLRLRRAGTASGLCLPAVCLPAPDFLRTRLRPPVLASRALRAPRVLGAPRP